MKRIVMALLITFLSALFSPSVVLASGTAEQAKTMVEQASAFFSANGKEKSLAEFNNPKGKFIKGELYVFVYDLNATVIAHPVNSKLIGKNLLEVPDADGKTFRKDIVELAKSKGTGWVDYKYKNPATNRIENKTTLIKKVGDIIICCGIYK